MAYVDTNVDVNVVTNAGANADTTNRSTSILSYIFGTNLKKSDKHSNNCPWCGDAIYNDEESACYNGPDVTYTNWLAHLACNNAKSTQIDVLNDSVADDYKIADKSVQTEQQSQLTQPEQQSQMQINSPPEDTEKVFFDLEAQKQIDTTKNTTNLVGVKRPDKLLLDLFLGDDEDQ